jgi:hypothetical protein
MWSAAIGILLILGGVAVALGPICYGFHREVLNRHLRELRSELASLSDRPPLKCAHCGEMVEDLYYVSVPDTSEYETEALSEAS